MNKICKTHMKIWYMIVSIFCPSIFTYAYTSVKLNYIVMFVDNPIFIKVHVKINLLLCSNCQKFPINPQWGLSAEVCVWGGPLPSRNLAGHKRLWAWSGLFPKAGASLQPWRGKLPNKHMWRFLSVYSTATPGNYTHSFIHSTKTFFTSTMCKIDRAECRGG